MPTNRISGFFLFFSYNGHCGVKNGFTKNYIIAIKNRDLLILMVEKSNH